MESEPAYLESVSAAVNVLHGKFDHFGDVVALHYLTDTCYPVVKPDTHVCRVLYRLGLIDVINPVGRQVHRVSLAAVKSGAQAGFSPRYTDIVLMRFGYHVCGLDLPKCSCCLANGVCQKRGVINHE
jgi:endonuclease III